ncbi:MAG: DNA polymerase III subunit beta [Chloroflexi bacterium]|nr:DNA polymerase III subunit beta [Chloroflexota bacterium]MCI0775954.1 DNA polymerase III subunit beta [Chloroflexota bacterium]MCI0804144.1 DNA polymerase III subunit beta [Chloroflexota bacterium]MCI0808653.1 DNA polymerase III subunit beta [Chloroflexota bacterium]MCI0834202.1 DNA polymerase III subunit beta [Chloroflexota bacterium]
MQVTCLRENLSRGLANISRAVAARATLPVTQNVLLEGDNGQLKLTATNTEISISTWIGAQIEGEGSVTVPARMLNDFVNSLPGQTVQIDFQTDPVGVHVTCDKFTATINGIAAEEFPPIPTVEGGASVTIPADAFRGALERVVFAAATDDSRPVLTGVKVELAEDSFTLAAADGFRLAVETGKLGATVSEEVGVIVPAKTLAEVERLLGDGSSSVELSVDANGRSAKFKLDTSEIVTALVQGTFPDYEKLIPTSYGTKATIDLASMVQATRAASIFARDGSGIIRVIVNPGDGDAPGTVKIISRAEEVGSNENELDASVEGEESKVAFNSKFLMDVLNVLSGDDVDIETTTPSSPGVFRSKKHEGYTHVVMPMFVQW